MSSKKQRRGRPPIDSERVDTRILRDDLVGLDKFSADTMANPDAPISRPEAIRRILRDWLVGHGYLPLDEA